MSWGTHGNGTRDECVERVKAAIVNSAQFWPEDSNGLNVKETAEKVADATADIINAFGEGGDYVYVASSGHLDKAGLSSYTLNIANQQKEAAN